MTGFILLHTITGGVTLLPVADIAAVVNGTRKKSTPKATGARRLRDEEEGHDLFRNGHLQPRYQAKGDWSSPAVVELRDGTELAVTETVEEVERLLEHESDHGRTVQLVLKAATICTLLPALEVGLGGLTVAQRDGKFWLRVYSDGVASPLEWEETGKQLFLQRVDALAARLLLRGRE